MFDLEIIIIMLCLSIDVLLTSFSYGVDKIKIPLKSVFIINLVTTILFIISLIIGSITSSFLDINMINIISFLILFALGITKLFEFSFKKLFSKLSIKEFKIYDFKFILQVVSDSRLADSDQSKMLSSKEAISLAIALSLDGICAAFSIGMSYNNYLIISLLSFTITTLMFISGNVLGKGFFAKKNLNIGWLCGVLLIALAVSKII